MAYDLTPIRHLYPFESHWLDLDGVQMHYLDEGSGACVLMLHGNPTWSFYWRELVKALCGKCRCVAPDHIGMGLSDKPLDYAYRLETHIANLERLVAELDLSDLTLVMHDWGGAIGCGFAVRHPDRVGRLVLLNTAAFLGPVPWRIRVCRWPVVGAVAVRGLNGFVRAAFHMATTRPGGLPREVRAGYLLPYDSYASRIGVHRFVQDIPMSPWHPTYGLIQQIDTGLAGLLDKPVTIGWGLHDFCFTESFLEEWLRRFPQAEVHRFADAGHYVMEDAAAAVAEEVGRFCCVF